MAYEKHIWECGEVITAEKLNNMENGIAQGGGGTEPLILTVTVQYDVPCEGSDNTHAIYTYDHSWQEIYDALGNHIPVYGFSHIDESGVEMSNTFVPIAMASYIPDDGHVVLASIGNPFRFADATSLVYEETCSK